MPQVSKLRLDHQKAKDVVKHYLNEGHREFYSAPSTDPGLAEAEQNFGRWTMDAMAALERSFTTIEIAEGFWVAKDQVMLPHIPDETDEQFRYRTLMNSYHQRVQFLKRIKGTVDTYQLLPESKRDSLIVSSKLMPLDIEKVTVSWLYHNVPAKMWWTFFGLLISAVAFGLLLAQTPLIKQSAEKTVINQPAPQLASEEFKNQIDQLTKGHNERRLKFTDAIIDQNRGGSALSTYADRERAIANLQKDIENEDATYQNKLKTLQSLISSAKP